MADVEQHLVELEQRQVEAFNRRAIDEVLAHFDPALVGFSSTRHDRLHGLEDLRKTFHYYLDQAEEVSYEIQDPEVVVYGDVAIVTFYWVVRLTDGGRTRSVRGRGTHVYLRRNDSWKVVHEHFSRAHRRA
ncbi:MAG: nuclear transport factor 2 family protein [candidate division KSB1 bacterium]|nr:nuclear transport factor 2 family protein [candidate division KSB1 bacterium]